MLSNSSHICSSGWIWTGQFHQWNHFFDYSWSRWKYWNHYCGDYNCTMINELDRYNCSTLRDIGQIDLKLLMERYDWEDIWRRRYPDKKQFSWEGREKFSRIDYFLVSKSLDCQIDMIQKSDAPFSDHSVVHLKSKQWTFHLERGYGKWMTAP